MTHSVYGVVVKKRYECKDCTHRYNTMEVYEHAFPEFSLEFFARLGTIKREASLLLAQIEAIHDHRLRVQTEYEHRISANGDREFLDMPVAEGDD